MREFIEGLIHLLVAAACVQSIVIGALAWRRRDRPGMAWFSLLMLALGGLSALDFIEGDSIVAMVWSVALMWLLWVPAPALWLYIRATLGLTPMSRRAMLLHWLPALGVMPICAFMAWQISQSLSQPLQPIVLPAGWNVWSVVLTLGGLCGAVIYLNLCLLWLRRHRRALRNVLADPERHELHWMERMLAISGIVLLSWLIGLGFDQLWAQAFAGLALPICLLYIGIHAIRQPFVLGYRWMQQQIGVDAEFDPAEALPEPSGDDHPQTELPDPRSEPPSYARSGLTERRAQALLAELALLMSTEKPYQEQDLTLPDLAKRLGVPPQTLSQLLNQKIGLSFHEYIGDHRVHDVMRCLNDPAYDMQTVLAIAQDAGFRSKSVFHDAFRRATGTTPSRYRQQRDDKSASGAGR
jgi:AraC-like DNA-binding protein